MKVLVLRNEVSAAEGQTSAELVAEADVVGAAEDVRQALVARGHEVRLMAVTSDELIGVLLAHDPREWLIFHLIESLDGRAGLEPYALSIYESLGFTSTAGPFLSHYNCLHKHRAKQILKDHGLATPRWLVATHAEDPLEDVPLPAIVKPAAEDASIGIAADAVATTLAEVRERVELIERKHHQPALIEEFIIGREFTVGLWGNDPVDVLPLSEMKLDASVDPLRRILSYEAKWLEGTTAYDESVPICPAVLEPEIAERVRALARDAFVALGCRDYAHADIRVRDGQPYLLEMNPACDLAAGLGFARQTNVAGHSYEDTIERIAMLAHARMKR
jgi:D-alanine-D-alanine ligase